MASLSHVRCDEVVEMVTDYLERALDVSEAEALEQHLLICGPCAEYVEQIRQVVSKARQLDLAQAVTDASEAEVDPLVAKFRRWKAREGS